MPVSVLTLPAAKAWASNTVPITVGALVTFATWEYTSGYSQYTVDLTYMNIGIASAEIKGRKVHIHAWRHFFNTEMLKGGMTTKQAQAITTHKSER